MSPLTRGGKESLIDNSMRLAQIEEEVIPQVEMRELITEGKGKRPGGPKVSKIH